MSLFPRGMRKSSFDSCQSKPEVIGLAPREVASRETRKPQCEKLWHPSCEIRIVLILQTGKLGLGKIKYKGVQSGKLLGEWEGDHSWRRCQRACPGCGGPGRGREGWMADWAGLAAEKQLDARDRENRPPCLCPHTELQG